MDLEVVLTASQSMTLYCNNSGAISKTKEPRSHKRIKYIERKYHLIRDIAYQREVMVYKIVSEDNLDDLFTKARSTKSLEDLVGLGLQRM